MSKVLPDKTLEELVGKWREEIPVDGYSSSIQLRTYHLYRTKMNEYSVDDTRFMIIQEVGLKFLVPTAVQYLKENILIGGAYYEGDLLNSLLLLPKKYWRKNLKLYGELYQVLLGNKHILDSQDVNYSTTKIINENVEHFLKVLI